MKCLHATSQQRYLESGEEEVKIQAQLVKAAKAKKKINKIPIQRRTIPIVL